MADRYLLNGQPVAGFSRDADSIDYDNTGTGLSSTDVQGAISEIKSNLSNKIVTDSYTITFGSLNAGASNTVTKDITKSGYKAIAWSLVQTFGDGYANLVVGGAREFSDTTLTLIGLNVGSSANNAGVIVKVAYSKN